MTEPFDTRPEVGLGRDFRLLWAAYGSSNLADGILLAAGPLLVATLTRDPLLVALGVSVQLAPTFLFSLVVGAWVDRADRRRLQTVSHAARAVVLVLIAATIGGDAMTLPLLYAALFVLGSAEVVGDTAGETLVAATVPKPLLGAASSRLVGTFKIANTLAGPPLGALLLGAGLALPFVTNAVLLLAASVLVSRISVDGRGQRGQRGQGGQRGAGAAPAAAPFAQLRADIVEGLRFTWATPPVRRLVVVIAVANVAFGAVWGIQVLWALERLGLDAVGFGLLLTFSAVGGVVGSLLFPGLERRFSYAALLRTGLVIESATHFLLAASTTPVLAGAVLVVFGMHEAVWGSLSSAIRLHIVPEEVLGRVQSVYRLAIIAPLLLGSALGGVLAGRFGIIAPFLYAGIATSVTTLVMWRSLADLGSAAEHA